MWPTRALADNARWFDELYVWTEGFEASTMQRARFQFRMLSKAFMMLETEHAERIATTLSFGTVERLLDLLTDAFEVHPFVAHRMVVLLRGDIARMRSPYAIQGFVDWLRAHKIPIGYRTSAPRISMEMRTVDLLRPDFIKIGVPASKRIEYWQDMAVETRMSGIDAQRVIVAGVNNAEQRQMAQDAGFGFAQGHAIKAAYDPPLDKTAQPRPATYPAYHMTGLAAVSATPPELSSTFPL